jgi:hypothetical protein
VAPLPRGSKPRVRSRSRAVPLKRKTIALTPWATPPPPRAVPRSGNAAPPFSEPAPRSLRAAPRSADASPPSGRTLPQFQKSIPPSRRAIPPSPRSVPLSLWTFPLALRALQKPRCASWREFRPSPEGSGATLADSATVSIRGRDLRERLRTAWPGSPPIAKDRRETAKAFRSTRPRRPLTRNGHAPASERHQGLGSPPYRWAQPQRRSA